MREEICKFMPFWEIALDKDKEILGRYNQKYFSEAKIGEITKIVYASYIREGHHLIIRNSAEKIDYHVKTEETKLIGNAKEIVPKLDYKFDLIFLDAGKKDYPIYYELILPKLRKGGIILADNILWSGKILDENMDKTSVILDEFNKQVVEDSRVENVLLPIRDGIMMIRKIK